MTRGLFVTGTDTGAGKTVVAAAIAASLRAAGRRVAAYKPVLTGTDDAPVPGWPPDDELLAAAAGGTPAEVVARRFGPAVSPHLAASLAGVELDIGELVAEARRVAAGADVLVAEGVGGLLVPLSPTASVRAQMSRSGSRLASSIALILASISSTGITCLPGR